MEHNRKRKGLLIGAVILLGLLLFFLLVLQPQSRMVAKQKANVSELQGRVAAEKKLRESRPGMEKDFADIKAQVEILKTGYFIPFLQENVLLTLTSLMTRYGMEIFDMRFSEPERVTLKVDKPSDTHEADSFPQVLDKLTDGSLEMDRPDRDYLHLAEKYYAKALELLAASGIAPPGSETVVMGYTLDRVRLQVAFKGDNTKRILDLVNLLEESRPYFPVASINLSLQQDGWTGNMELHLYRVPDFPEPGDAYE